MKDNRTCQVGQGARDGAVMVMKLSGFRELVELVELLAAARGEALAGS